MSARASNLARLPKGMRDVPASEVRLIESLLGNVRRVYDLYGFEPLDTPTFEYSDSLGKFLPDQDRPNEGVFSFKMEEDAWVSLRYDLTAPLARYVALESQALAKPYRRYQSGYVYRNEKPGPGRFCQFMQFDADTVGTEDLAADAEACMVMADALEACGIPRGGYLVKVNNRKILDGALDAAGLRLDDAINGQARRLTILRAIDKFDKFGVEGVAQLLGKGRRDESGDFTRGADLSGKEIDLIFSFVNVGSGNRRQLLDRISPLVETSAVGREGLAELDNIDSILTGCGFGSDRICIETSIVRGLEYYTGPVFEADLQIEALRGNADVPRFGSVGSGGRYDDLVARFTGQKVPATGSSIGVSRLIAAFEAIKGASPARNGPVVVLVMDRDKKQAYMQMTQALRNAGIRAEMYLGSSGMKAQLKYADRRNSPLAIIQGTDERQNGEVKIKNLIEGARAADSIADNKTWRQNNVAQISVTETKLVETVREMLATIDQDSTQA